MQNKKCLERCLELIRDKRYRELSAILAEQNPVDLADLLEGLPQEQGALAFRTLPKEQAAEVFSNLPPDTQQMIVVSLPDRELAGILEELAMDDTVDLLEELPAGVVKRVLKNARPETRRLINQFLKYPEQSVGSIMTAEFIDLKGTMTAAEAIRRIRRLGGDCESIYTCYVTDGRPGAGRCSHPAGAAAGPRQRPRPDADGAQRDHRPHHRTTRNWPSGP